MRLLIQRVKKACVTVNQEITGNINYGLLVYLGIHKEDTYDKIDWLVNKLVHLRIFRDEKEKMNRDIRQIHGEILVVSQFTLYGNLQNGRRPEFTDAAAPDQALHYYERFVDALSKGLGRPVQTGIFGALMEVSSTNDGPVTFLLER